MVQKYLTHLITCIALVTLMAAFTASAQDTKKSYRIAINHASDPYHFINESGEADGMLVELWQLWAKKQAVAVEFVPLSSQKAIQQTQSGEVDIYAGLFQNAEVESQLDLSEAFFRQNSHLFLHRSIANIKSILQLTPYAIGVFDGSSHEFTLKQKYPNLTVKSFSDRNALYQAALAGEILIMAGVEKISKNYTDFELLSQQYPAFARISYENRNYSAAVARGNESLLNFIQQGMEKISQQEKTAIKSKWLIVENTEDVITLSYSNNQMPFSDTSSDGIAQGFFIELWQMWAKSSGLDIEFVMGDSTEFNQTNTNMADIHITSINKEQGHSINTLGPVIYSVQYGLFFSNNVNKVLHLSLIHI